MKYLVNISYTNPAHEHVSLRRRVDTINRVVEARSEEEALNRAANQQRALGFLVREAKVLEEAVSFGRSGGVMHYDPKTEKSEKPAKGVSALDKDGNLVGHYRDLETAKKMKPGHTYQTSKGVAKEEVEQTDESRIAGVLGAMRVAADKNRLAQIGKKYAAAMAADVEKQGKYSKKYPGGAKQKAKDKEAFMKRFANEEVEQTDEALLPKQQTVADKLKASELAANKEKAGYKFGKGLRAAKVAAKMKKEEVEQIDELSPATYTSAAQKARGQGTAYAAKATTQAGAAMYGSQQGKHEPNSRAARMDAFAQKRFALAKKAEKKAGLQPGEAGIHSYDPTPGDKGYSKSGPKPLTREEVEQIDELKKSTLASYTGKASKDAATHSAMASYHDTSARARGKNRPDSKLHMTLADIRGAKAKKRLAGVEKATAKLAKEEVEYIEEKLTAADPASEWIKDFVASDNPKFAGKTKKERIQMALGAYYSAKRAKNEATEKKYNEKEVKHAEKKQDKKQGSLNKIEMEPEIEMHSKGVK